MVRGRCRSKKGSSESLELLLDTVTNTFGGILFLAILVAIILQSTSTSPQSEEATESEVEPLSEVDLAETEVRITALTDRIAALQSQLKKVPPRKETQADEETGQLVEELQAVEEEITQAVVDKAHAEMSVASLQQETAGIHNESMNMEERKKDVEEKNQLVSEELGAEKDKASQLAMAVREAQESLDSKALEQTVTLPVLKKTSKKAFTFYVRYGKLFLTFNNDGSMNTDHFFAVGQPPVAFCRPERGIPLLQSSVDKVIKRELSGFSTSSYFIQILVFEDSFDQFQMIKKVLVGLAYEYGVSTCRPDEMIRFGDVQGSAQ